MCLLLMMMCVASEFFLVSRGNGTFWVLCGDGRRSYGTGLSRMDGSAGARFVGPPGARAGEATGSGGRAASCELRWGRARARHSERGRALHFHNQVAKSGHTVALRRLAEVSAVSSEGQISCVRVCMICISVSIGNKRAISGNSTRHFPTGDRRLQREIVLNGNCLTQFSCSLSRMQGSRRRSDPLTELGYRFYSLSRAIQTKLLS